MWILSRDPLMKQSTYMRLVQLASKLVPYDAPNKLIRTGQANCTYA